MKNEVILAIVHHKFDTTELNRYIEIYNKAGWSVKQIIPVNETNYMILIEK